ncbi:PQQ-binding-like beta-propeller repeat protein [Streptomyces sp. NPDC056527]|uniref:protein kinase domain-containing protein n=1 Tax=Streptomyces sp. NPDC056527 TaxID=3345853 RepID=UPI0036B1A2AD
MNPLDVGDPLRLGPYRLIGVLGEGGMGKVYLAADQGGRPAAVKVLRPDLAHDQHLAQRFVREAGTAQSVTGKGFARVLGAQTEGGRPWIATEFLAGPTLEEAVAAHGALDEPSVRALASSLARTLGDIHAAGLIHRDIKPANIVLTSDGPRVIDFGIARPEHGLTLTTTGQIPVTPGYGAPEQVLGRRVTGAADVFSLGAVLVYAATGRPAYTGPHVAAVQYAVVHDQPDLARLSPQLRALVEPCLAKDAVLRPTPEQIARVFSVPRNARPLWRHGPVFQEIKERETTVLRQTTAARTAGRSMPDRRRFLATWGVGGGVLLAAGGGSAWWLSERAANELPPAGDAPDAPLLEAESEGIRPKPLWGPVEAAARGPLPTPVVLRDVVIFAARDGGLTALAVTDGKQKWTLPHLSVRARQLAVDEDHVAVADDSGRLTVLEASTSAERWSVADADVALLLAADSGGIYFITKKGTLRAVDITGRKVRWTGPSVKTPEGDTGPLAAAGGNRLVVSLASGNVSAVDTTTGRELWEIRGQGTTALQPLIDGDTIYLGGRTLTAVTLDGRRLWAVDAHWPPSGTQGGWGPPVLDGEGIIAVGGAFAYRYEKSGKSDGDLFAGLKGTRPPLTPPVIQGNCIWVIEGDPDYGVSGLSKPNSKRVWTYERDNRGPWSMTGAGNRVFLISRGQVVAMPTF